MGYGKITKAEAARREKLAEQGLKVCGHCKEEKPFEQFTKEAGTKDGYRPICKSCAHLQNIARRGYYENYREENRQALREWYHLYYAKKKPERIEYNQRRKKHFSEARIVNDHRVHNRYKLYIRNSTIREIEFALTLSEFDAITRLPCHYCGDLPSDGHGSAYTGVDRIDSSKGYFLDNVVPCCEVCNKMKLNYTPLEWLAKIKKIYEHMNL